MQQKFHSDYFRDLCNFCEKSEKRIGAKFAKTFVR